MPATASKTPFVIRPRIDLLTQHPQLGHASANLALKYAFHYVVTDDELQAIGQGLWAALQAADPELEAAFDRARQQAGTAVLPLVIDSDQAAIQRLPWETLYHPTHGFLGKSPAFTLLRQVAAAPSEPPILQSGPLRVLLFTSLPDDLNAETGRLSVEEQQAQTLESLTPLISAGLVRLEMPDDGRFATLRQLLQSFQPHLLFLFGHGRFYDQPHMEEKPFAIFQFEDDDGGSDLVREEEIADAFYGSTVTGVVLSACESGKGSSAALTHGLAWRLSQMGIPHVIGMRESILERAGILFNRTLCEAIARQERMDVALQRARQAITTPLKETSSAWLKSGDEGLGELSLGQWCLPALISRDASQPLIDWQFLPQPPEAQLTNATLQTITLPPRFVGRRSELRDLKSRLRRGALHQLLLTGPGGQGKTALAGKLAQDLQRRGYTVLAWSAAPGSDWEKFVLDVELELSPENGARYSQVVGRYSQEQDQVKLLLRLLLAEKDNRVVLFFDNLETIQDPKTLALTDKRVTAWIAAAQSLTAQGLTLLLTSRWQLPGWPDADHWPLDHASYGDFLQMALQQKLPADLLNNRERLRRVYRALHGNGRGLQFFAGAAQNLTAAEEDAFLQKLAQAEAELRTNMALDLIGEHLTAAEEALLERLRAYHVPVPVEGVLKLGLDLPTPEALHQRLLAVSLLERQYNTAWQTYEYQLPQPVMAWLAERLDHPTSPSLRRAAADFLDYLYRRERPTLQQAIILHQAWLAAEEVERANRLALDRIVGPLNRAGLFRTLLTDWLPPICQSGDRQTQAEALGQTGKQHHHLGTYDTALDYLQQSLKIMQAIGDKAGEGTTLNNISQIFTARGDYDTALNYLQQSLKIMQAIGDKAGEGTTLNNISQIFTARGDYDTALNYLQQSLKIQQAIGNKAGEGATLSNMAATAQARGDYDTALDYFQQSLKIMQAIGDKAGEGTTLNNISQIFTARGDYDTALNYLQQSLKIQQAIGNKAGEGATLSNMAATAQARGDYDTALDYFQQSLKIMQAIGDKAGEGTTLNN
ncbi:MAG: tetratricopeptide repeat protein, partial [Chloroflexi bacterium]|nr:tetratricopeptide repeat protein [Chloroflexota bacterium]